jgi:toxin HigB-1
LVNVIKSFKHKGLEQFYNTGSLAGIQAKHKQKLRMRLIAMDTATNIQDIDLPGFRLHPLKGDKAGLWAIDVSKNWRITFKFQDGSVYVVDYEDYH